MLINWPDVFGYVFVLQWQKWVVASGTIWLTKLEYLLSCHVKKKILTPDLGCKLYKSKESILSTCLWQYAWHTASHVANAKEWFAELWKQHIMKMWVCYGENDWENLKHHCGIMTVHFAKARELKDSDACFFQADKGRGLQGSHKPPVSTWDQWNGKSFKMHEVTAYRV